MGRREEILDALIEILSNKGISSNFTMKEIASKVNIGKSTIYEYFETKDDLLNQAVCRLVETGITTVFAREDKLSGNFETEFKKELYILFSMSLDSSNILNMLSPTIEEKMNFGHNAEIMNQIGKVRNHYNQRFEAIFNKGVSEGLFAKSDIGFKNLLISSLIVGSIIRISNSDVEFDKSYLSDYIEVIYNTVIDIAK